MQRVQVYQYMKFDPIPDQPNKKTQSNPHAIRKITLKFTVKCHRKITRKIISFLTIHFLELYVCEPVIDVFVLLN